MRFQGRDMLNKFNASLLATIVFGILFPLGYYCVTGVHLQPVAVAISAVIFFFVMLAAFGKLLCKQTFHQG
jgi:hypothetical protein